MYGRYLRQCLCDCIPLISHDVLLTNFLLVSLSSLHFSSVLKALSPSLLFPHTFLWPPMTSKLIAAQDNDSETWQSSENIYYALIEPFVLNLLIVCDSFQL